jgi:hypothetical protein
MERDVLAAPPLQGGAARGGGQPAGLAAAPTKYHRLAFRNSLHQRHQRLSPPPYQPLSWKPPPPKSEAAPILVSFHELIPETPDTNYLTHNLFSYPPHSIPHVPRFFAHLYASGGGGIDSFVGSGTVAPLRTMRLVI